MSTTTELRRPPSARVCCPPRSGARCAAPSPCSTSTASACCGRCSPAAPGWAAPSRLSATAAWLIARASQMPPILELGVASVAVRTFGISRAPHALPRAPRLPRGRPAGHGVAARARLPDPRGRPGRRRRRAAPRRPARPHRRRRRRGRATSWSGRCCPPPSPPSSGSARWCSSAGCTRGSAPCWPRACCVAGVVGPWLTHARRAAVRAAPSSTPGRTCRPRRRPWSTAPRSCTVSGRLPRLLAHLGRHRGDARPRQGRRGPPGRAGRGHRQPRHGRRRPRRAGARHPGHHRRHDGAGRARRRRAHAAGGVRGHGAARPRRDPAGPLGRLGGADHGAPRRRRAHLPRRDGHARARRHERRARR